MRPDHLLLTDADIVHGSGNLRELVSRCETEGYDLVSLMVRLHCRSLWERLLIPAFVFFFFKLYPPRWVADPARRTAGAAGGCMLIRAATLERIGGIDSIRGEIIDDCALARRVKSVGKVWLGPLGTRRASANTGPGAPIWDMVVRSAFAQLGYSPLMLALTLLMLILTYLAPPLLLLVVAAGRGVVRRGRLARHEHCLPADFAGLRCPAPDCFAAAPDCAFLCRSDRRLGGAVLARPRRLLEGARSGARARQHLMQLARQSGDRVVDQRRAAPLVERGGDDLTRSGDRDIDGDGADLGDRLASSCAIRSCANCCRRLRFSSRSRSDCAAIRSASSLAWVTIGLGLGRSFLLLALIGGERLLRLVAQIVRRIELLSDALGAASSAPTIVRARASRRRQERSRRRRGRRTPDR